MAWVASACTDSRGNLDDFSHRVIDASNISGPDAEVLAEIPDVSGEFVFGLDPSLAQGRIIRFRVTSVLTPGATAADATTLALTFQPLDKDTLEPAGAPIKSEPAAMDVSATGEFAGQLAGDIVGAANPITGADVTVDTQLAGIIRDKDLLCGTIDGAVTAPITASLNGSTFDMVRIPAGADLVDVPIIGRCPAPAGTPDAGVPDGGADASLDAGVDASSDAGIDAS